MKIDNYTKDNKKYSVRDQNSSGHKGSTADYSENGDLKKKIRLGE